METSHYGIHVYDGAPPPAGTPSYISLCPEARKMPVMLVQEVAQVKCRRCLQLLDVIGLRPIQ